MAIKLKIEGFEDLLKEIETAGGSINTACESALRGSAQIMQEVLIEQMKSAGAPSDLISRMPAPEIQVDGNRISARVGYKATAYNQNDLSDYFKAIFLNYGTPHRKKHGVEKSRGFVAVAKKKAKPKMKRLQKQAFEKILARLKK